MTPAEKRRLTMAQTIAREEYACFEIPDAKDKKVKEILKELSEKELIDR